MSRVHAPHVRTNYCKNVRKLTELCTHLAHLVRTKSAINVPLQLSKPQQPSMGSRFFHVLMLLWCDESMCEHLIGLTAIGLILIRNCGRWLAKDTCSQCNLQANFSLSASIQTNKQTNKQIHRNTNCAWHSKYKAICLQSATIKGFQAYVSWKASEQMQDEYARAQQASNVHGIEMKQQQLEHSFTALV